jgi:hypothetical protein
VADAVSRAGVPEPAALGTRMALEPGRGRTAVPVRSTLAVAIVAVTGIVGALTFGRSLDRLSGSPARYGWPASLAIETFDNTKASLISGLVADSHLDSVALVEIGELRIGGTSTEGYSMTVHKGRMDFTILDGRMPRTRDEIALGPQLRDRLGARVGGTIRVDGRNGTTRRLRVVGVVLVPEDIADEGYAGAAALAPAALDLTTHSVGQPAVLVRFAAGADGLGLTARLARNDEAITPVPPTAVANLGQLGGLPDFLAIFLAVLGFVALGHALLATARRRRSDFAVLRTLGFVDRQLTATLTSAAATTAAIGLLFGVPLGLLLGSGLWGAVAGGVDVARDASLPWPGIAAVVVVTLALAAVLAAVAAPRIRRVNAAALLRSE